MRRLILFRHAKAEPRGFGEADIDRPLSLGGRVDAARAGQWLAGAGPLPDLALVSPSARTRQSWACVRDRFPGAREVVTPAIYDATAEEIAGAVAAASAQAEVLMVVGHNPGLQELGMDLLVEGRAADHDLERIAAGFPTSAIAVFRMVSERGGELESLFHLRRQE